MAAKPAGRKSSKPCPKVECQVWDGEVHHRRGCCHDMCTVVRKGCASSRAEPVSSECRPPPLSTTQAARQGSDGIRREGHFVSRIAPWLRNPRKLPRSTLRQFRRSATNNDQTHVGSGRPITCTVVASWAFLWFLAWVRLGRTLLETLGRHSVSHLSAIL